MAAAGSLSSVQLQSHYDEINSHVPVLPLSILPRSLASILSVHSLDASAARLVKKACTGLTECQVCSCSSQPDQLQLLLSTKLEFHTRAVHVTAAHLACSQCAAVSSASLLLQLLTPGVGAAVDEQRAEQLQQLCLHFAAVNNASASITGNPDSLALWVQELACRAYSLNVVVNSLKGWQLQPQGLSTTQILQHVLRPKHTTSSTPDAAQPAAASTPAAGKQKKQKHKQAAQQQQQQAVMVQESAPGSKRPGRAPAPAIQADQAAAARPKKHKTSRGPAPADAGLQTPVAAKQPQGSLKQHKSAGKHVRGDASPAVAGGVKKPSSRGKDSLGATALHTPQHSKIKRTNKHKLLKTAPR